MLGTAICDLLSEKNSDFVAPSRDEIDLTQINQVSNYLNDNNITKVIHCAALVGGIKANLERPADFLVENLLIDSCLFKAVTQSEVNEVLYMSSSCAYPLTASQPLRESDIDYGDFEATNRSYAIAKVTAMETIKKLNKQYNLNFRTLILSNLYGPNDDFTSENSHLVSATLRKCHDAKVNSLPSVVIWGHGEAKREFTYVYDVAEWIVSKKSDINSLPQSLNIGSGIELTVNEYYEIAAKVVGFSGTFEHDSKKPDGIPRKILDSSIARNLYGWNPKTSIYEGMSKTYQEMLKVN